jgi:hypothetical protein
MMRAIKWAEPKCLSKNTKRKVYLTRSDCFALLDKNSIKNSLKTIETQRCKCMSEKSLK